MNKTKAGKAVICPPCGENVGLPTKRGANEVSPILPFLPRLTAVLPQSGFTLIELLVVVLIIGILAAVAVPQYQKAVDRSRAAQTVQLINSLKQAVEVWMLAHPGEEGSFFYGDSPKSLDIDLPCEGDGECFIGIDQIEGAVELREGGMTYICSYHHYSEDWYAFIGAVYEDGKWTHKCGYFDDRSKAICEGLQGYEAIEGFEI